MNLKDRRLELGLTLEEVGKLTGVGKSTVRKWETGFIENMGRDKIVALSKALKLSPIDILYSSDEKNDDLLSEITKISYKLSAKRQLNVLNYTKKQLTQQNAGSVVSLNDYRNDQADTSVDVYGSVSAGTGEYLDDIKPEPVSIKGPVPDDYDFAVKVNGNSMEPTFNDGQIILVKKVVDDSEVRNNQFVIAEVNGEAYVKKLFIDDDGIRLISLNQNYKDIYISSFDDFVIRGIVVF